MSFYHKSNFTKIMPEDMAILTAKIANQEIRSRGVVLYGEQFDDSSGHNFSTKDRQTPQDTHVCIGLGMSELAQFGPDNEPPPHIDKVTQADEARAMEARIRTLEAENYSLRGK